MNGLRLNKGATLIEMLVGLFVLAIGLLGALGMQMNSVRSAQSAVFASDAQVLAQDMIDRIYAYNDVLDPADDGDYDGIDTDNAIVDPGCVSAGCTKPQIVATDTFEWRDEIVSRLPGGRGTVALNGSVYTVLVMWDRDRTGASNTGCGGNPDTDLTCYQVEIML